MSQAQILQIILLPGVLSFIVGLVITGVITLVNYLLPKLPAAQQARAKAIVSSVVRAVEQQGTALAGADKKAKAIQDIESILTALKINVPSTLINTLIESSVYEINQIQTTGTITPAPAQIDWPADALQAIQILTGAGTTGNTSPIPVAAPVAAAPTVSDGSNEVTATRPVVQPAQ